VNDYKIKTIVPSLSTTVYLNQIKNKNLFDISKFISSNDDTGLAYYLENLVKKIPTDNNFDKTFALLNLRMVCISNELKIKISQGSTPINYKFNINNILLNLLNNVNEPITKYVKEDLELELKHPSKLYYSNFIEFLIDIIVDLKIKKVEIDYKKLSIKNKSKLLTTLKKEIIKEIKDYLKLNQKIYTTLVFENSERKISFYDNTFFYFIKFLFNYNLSNLYNKMFLTCSALKLTYSEYKSLTPAETDVLIAIYKKNNNIK